MKGYNFNNYDRIVIIDTALVKSIETEILKLGENINPLVRFPDVRRQVILDYSSTNEGYKVVSYDKVSMELNGKLVVYNEKLADIIEKIIMQHNKIRR